MSAVADTQAVHTFDNGIKVHHRHLIPVQVDRYAQGVNLHEPEEERLFLGLIAESDPSGTFLDVGAAVGYYGILAKRSAPSLKIHAFEPYARHRQFLLENLQLNGLDSSAVVLHAEAVGAARGRSDFKIEHYGSTLVSGNPRAGGTLRERFKKLRSRWRLRAAPERDGETIEVSVTTLDEFTRRNGPAELVKVDVQGFEIDVLRGAVGAMTSKLIGRWLIGTHGEVVHRECAEILREHGYRIEVDSPFVPGQPDGVIIAKAA
ncbi:MAG: FkbM family methyltransferase [Planctomycetaceae bacterium]